MEGTLIPEALTVYRERGPDGLSLERFIREETLARLARELGHPLEPAELPGGKDPAAPRELLTPRGVMPCAGCTRILVPRWWYATDGCGAFVTGPDGAPRVKRGVFLAIPHHPTRDLRVHAFCPICLEFLEGETDLVRYENGDVRPARPYFRARPWDEAMAEAESVRENDLWFFHANYIRFRALANLKGLDLEPEFVERLAARRLGIMVPPKRLSAAPSPIAREEKTASLQETTLKEKTLPSDAPAANPQGVRPAWQERAARKRKPRVVLPEAPKLEEGDGAAASPAPEATPVAS